MYSTSSLDKQITNDTFLLIYDNKNLIAYISISKEDDRSFTIQKLYVSTEVQGRGIGRFAIDAGVKYIKDLFDVDEISLSLFVNRSNKAVEFYKKMTFEIVAERDFHIGNDYYMNDYIMKRVY
jgi:ribosomal protein S18 acetylase RimI-like enzyme